MKNNTLKYNIKFVSLVFTCIVFVLTYRSFCEMFFKKPSIEQKPTTVQYQQQKKNFKDYDCLSTLNEIIQQDEENNFVIPPNEILITLPNHVLDCLYHRYTKTLHVYCSQRSRHGYFDDGWNVCVDGCYKPTTNDVFHIVSVHNDSIMVKSVDHIYQSAVKRYDVKLFKEYDQGSLSVIMGDSSNGKTRKDILIVDVGNSTKNVLDKILHSKLLNDIQQLSIRIFYGDKNLMKIDYIPALNHLRQLYNNGFRIYWSRPEMSCVLKYNRNRSSCIYLDMVFKTCKDNIGSIVHQHLIIPDDSKLASMNTVEIEAFYHKYLTSTQIFCKEVIRLGGIKDGGWDVCNDAKYKPEKPCLVYSFGINWDFNFDDAIAEAFGCEVHSFDPSMHTSKDHFKHSEMVWFYQIGLSNKTYYDTKKNWTLATLSDIRARLGHSLKTINIIKVDIELSEWKALPDMIGSGALRNITQFYIEFHSLGTREDLKIIRLLYEEGFRIFWYHRNPACLFKRHLIQHSQCMEVYFIRA